MNITELGARPRWSGHADAGQRRDDIAEKRFTRRPVAAGKPPVTNAAEDGGPKGKASKDGWPSQFHAHAGFSPAMAHMWFQHPQHRSLTEAGGSMIRYLGLNGVAAKLGGSLAARANGGMRNPSDLDIEVSNPMDFERGYKALSQLNSMVTMPDGMQVHMQGRPTSYYPGRMGIVNVLMTYATGERQSVDVDMVNENADNLDPHIYAPWQRQTTPGYVPGNMLPGELIINSLSRHMFKPDLSAQKQDVYQIAALLRHAGLSPHQELATNEVGARIVASFQPAYQAFAQQKFREIVMWMANGQI